jgi:PAS domain S-box-containing protein
MQGVLQKRVPISAVWITLVYLLLSLAWVAGTDKLVAAYVKDYDLFLTIQTYKGWFFVILTSILIFVLIRRAEKSLKSIENRSKILLEAIPDIVFRFDIDGVFVDYSTVDETSLAFPPEYFLGKNVTEVLPADIALPMVEAIKKALQTGKVQTFEYQIQTPKGMMFNEARVVAKNDDVIAFVRNITERSRYLEALKNSENKFSQIFRNNPEIMTISSMDRGVYWDVNEAFVLELGWPREEVVGKSMADINFWEDPNIGKQMIGELAVNKALKSSELGLRCKNGKIITCLCSMTEIIISGVSCLLFLGVKVQENKVDFS